MNNTNWENLPSTNTPITAEELNKLDRVVIVSTSGTNLNDFTTDGEYYFNSNITPTNIPIGVNGWLKVMTGTDQNGQYIKQIWYRHGTANVNSFQTYVRTRTAANTWSNWARLLVEDEVYFKSGNSITFPSQTTFAGMITGGSQNIVFTVFTNKSLTNINTITIDNLYLSVRVPSGGYVLANNSNFKTYASVQGKFDGGFSISLLNSNGWGVANNTPISVSAENFKVTFS